LRAPQNSGNNAAQQGIARADSIKFLSPSSGKYLNLNIPSDISFDCQRDTLGDDQAEFRQQAPNLVGLGLTNFGAISFTE
jgi:hypothetical protein